MQELLGWLEYFATIGGDAPGPNPPAALPTMDSAAFKAFTE